MTDPEIWMTTENHTDAKPPADTQGTPPLDLDRIRTHSSHDVPALIAEVTRLRQELDEAEAVGAETFARLLDEQAAHAKTIDNFEAFAEQRPWLNDAMRDALAVRLEQAERVVEAAVAWVDGHRIMLQVHPDKRLSDQGNALAAAVDTYQATPTTSEPATWQPGDPVYPPQREWITCACGTAVLWAPDMPTVIQCPECGAEIDTASEPAP